MTNSYSTAAEIKALMPDTAWGTSYDALFNTIVVQASRMIDGFLAREPGAFAVGDAATRYFDGSGTRELWIGELAAAPTAVLVAESGDVDDVTGTNGTYTTWGTGDYLAWPYNALGRKRPIIRLDINQLYGSKAIWYAFPKAVKITGYFGFATTSNLPEEIKRATQVQTVRWFKRAQQAFQDAGTIPELGQLKYVKELDPDVRTILNEGKFKWL